MNRLAQTAGADFADVLGHEVVGSGPVRVVVMNDWLCDTSTWDGARAYLDGARFTYVFADLRGYGRSRGRAGAFTVTEAAADVLALTTALGFQRFAVVGHSMSALVALHLAQHHGERLERIAVVAPPPPTGLAVDAAGIAASRELALADDGTRVAILRQYMGERLSPAWATHKAARWRASADAVAAAEYVTMFARDGLPQPEAPIALPVLAITGEQDAPPMRSEAVARALEPICSDLRVLTLQDSGHYPMQELPPLTVSLVERFLG